MHSREGVKESRFRSVNPLTTGACPLTSKPAWRQIEKNYRRCLVSHAFYAVLQLLGKLKGAVAGGTVEKRVT